MGVIFFKSLSSMWFDNQLVIVLLYMQSALAPALHDKIIIIV